MCVGIFTICSRRARDSTDERTVNGKYSSRFREDGKWCDRAAALNAKKTWLMDENTEKNDKIFVSKVRFFASQ